MKSSLTNMVLTLLIITAVAAGSLGFVYGLTKGPIEASKTAKTTGALSQVLPEFDNDPMQDTTTVTLDGFPILVYTAKKGNTPVGYAVRTQTMQGYGGLIQMMVGFKADGEVINIEVLQHNETPGLGSKMADPDNVLLVSFRGKNPADMNISVKKDGGDVDVITASTISSRAYSDAVARAYTAFQSVAFGAEIPEQVVVDPYEAVLSAFDNDPSAEENTARVPLGDDTVTVHLARMGAELSGFAIEGRAQGFGGVIVLLVGFDTEDTITGIHVLSHQESNGWGAAIADEDNPLKASFVGKNAFSLDLSRKEDGGDIDGISGSTITTGAYIKAVEMAVKTYSNLTGRGAK